MEKGFSDGGGVRASGSTHKDEHTHTPPLLFPPDSKLMHAVIHLRVPLSRRGQQAVWPWHG